ncbi:hypothetical protein M9Y10_009856 [Tritrichomonas musculus]|uniref:Vacuolar import/degradation Vid27 C-terminal domain-containing protein n=1 Tax=Tritrichomonas musculus TaxID=1915356 RepID=A0ABR2IR68_9EUKA
MSDSCLISCPVQVYQTYRNSKKLVGDDCSIQIIKTEQFSFMFYILDSNSQTLVSADIASALSTQFSLSSLTLDFNIRYQNKLHNINLVFNNKDDLKRFVNIFVNSMYEQKNQKRVAPADLNQIDQIIDSMSIDNQDANFSADDELFNEDEQAQSKSQTDGGHNFLLRIAPLTQNTMVMRKYDSHCDLGLFTNDSNCQFRMKIPSIADSNGKNLSMSDMLTSNADHNLLLLDENRPNELFDMSLDRGVVVGQYNTKDSMNISHKVSHLIHKNQNNSQEPVVVGFNNKNTMFLDTRVQNPIVKISEYKGNNQFLCGVTTRSGRMAMGSADGTIRLYREPCRSRATVNFHVNVGEEPVIAIDVSPDEQWIVATCPDYISVFSVLAPSTQKLAFDFPMKDEKTSLMKLVISQNDQQIIAQTNGGNSLPFTSARFDVKNGKVVAIIASIGNALVSWNFKSIMNYRIPKYSITFIPGESIIDNHPLETSDVLYIAPNQVSVALRQKKPK